MQARNLIGSGLLAVGMLLAGCGGTPVDETQVDDLGVREDAIPDCSGQDYEYTYYSDAAKTTVIGSRGCSCGVWGSWGRTSSYYDYYSGTCF
jgi:hypothetical protein